MSKRSMLLQPTFDEAFRQTWFQRALSVERANLIGLWMHNEAAGAALDRSGNSHDGVYSDVTLGQPGIPKIGYTAGSYNGIDSFTNIHSAELAAAFNGKEGTFLTGVQVDNVNVWTDGYARLLVVARVDVDNRLYIRKSDGDNTLGFQYTAGGISEFYETIGHTDLDFMLLGITWSLSNDRFRGYKNGVQESTTKTSLGTWVGDLDETLTVIGALSTVPSAVWKGIIGPCLLSTKEYTPAQMKYLG